MILKLSMQHRGLRLYKVDINEDHGMTLTYFTARSNLARYAFESRNLLNVFLQIWIFSSLELSIYSILMLRHYCQLSTIFKHLLRICLANHVGLSGPTPLLYTRISHLLPNHLETRHGPSWTQRFIYIVYINDDTGLTFTNFTTR